MFEKIVELIEQYDSIVIFGHLNPDGDCYGSAIALKQTLKLKYPHKKIYITGSGLKEFFKFLYPMDKVTIETIEKSLALILDANDFSRMEDKRIRFAKAFAKIDHHVDSGFFTEGPSFVDEYANSTCELIYALMKENDYPINEKIANALYLGIVTDTGHFQFVNNYPETFALVSYLCANGAKPKAIDAILNMREEKTLKTKGYVLSNYKKTSGGALYIVFTQEVIRKLNSTTNEMSSMVNLIGNVINYPVWVSFAEYNDGKVRLEIRSNGPVIQPVALRVGGGGHQYAAGATLPALTDEIVKEVMDDVDREIDNWRKNN